MIKPILLHGLKCWSYNWNRIKTPSYRNEGPEDFKGCDQVKQNEKSVDKNETGREDSLEKH